MIKRLGSIILLIVLILVLSTDIYATNVVNKLKVIKDTSETKYFENDYGFFSQKIVDSKPESGEVTVELKVNNSPKDFENTVVYENTEIYLLVSENIIVQEGKLEKNINNIEKLASKIFSDNDKVKIGIIGITGTLQTIGDGYTDGTEDNAEVVVKPTNNIDELKNGLTNMNPSKKEYRENLQSSIRLANKSFSNEVNKILISLYDGVPDIAIGVHGIVSYAGTTPEKAITEQHENIATYTRDEILKLKSSNISFILLRPDDTSYDEEWYDVDTEEKILDFDGSPYVQKLYGTLENPTYGKMYSFTDESIDKIITEDIAKDIIERLPSEMNNIKLVYSFPNDIIDNFDFSLEGSTSKGTASDKIDLSSKTISWDIGTLTGGETAVLKYKLKLKNINNTALLNKIINVNDQVSITYKDEKQVEHTANATSSPTIQLIQEEQKTTEQPNKQPTTNNNNDNNKKDNTVSNIKYPNTGIYTLVGLGVLIIVTIVLFKKYRSYKDVK